MRLLSNLGKYIIFLGTLMGRPEKNRMYWKETLRQMNDIGVKSLPIIAIVSLFIGAVTAVQFAYQLEDYFVPLYYVGFIVRDSMILEMAPTVTCMILAGKVGSNMASELGNMSITEQLDAMQTMGLNDRTYMVATKIVAAVVTIPFLVVVAAAVGMFGGMVAVVLGNYASAQEFHRGLISFFTPGYLNIMLYKSIVFAFILSTISSYLGYKVKGGAIEIAKASTQAVVTSNIFILAFDFLIARLFL